MCSYSLEFEHICDPKCFSNDQQQFSFPNILLNDSQVLWSCLKRVLDCILYKVGHEYGHECDSEYNHQTQEHEDEVLKRLGWLAT